MLSTAENFKSRAYHLGYMGLLPLVIGTGLAMVDVQTNTAITAIHSYAAVILTFIGAIHWGRAMQVNDMTLLNLSIWPSLIAWFSLLVSPVYGLPLLIACYLTVFAFDYREYAYAELDWFRRLRTQLTFVVCTLLAISWFYA